MKIKKNHKYWMKKAILLANYAKKKKEIPIGAIILFNNIIIGKGSNNVISSNNSTSHAEIIAIKKASKLIRNYRLNNTKIYVTLQPCIMCLGAILNARISKLIFGTKNLKISYFKIFKNNLSIFYKYKKKIKFKKNILKKDCLLIIKNFFKKIRIKNKNKKTRIKKQE